jgi:hypothetical protein
VVCTQPATVLKGMVRCLGVGTECTTWQLHSKCHPHMHLSPCPLHLQLHLHILRLVAVPAGVMLQLAAWHARLARAQHYCMHKVQIQACERHGWCPHTSSHHGPLVFRAGRQLQLPAAARLLPCSSGTLYECHALCELRSRSSARFTSCCQRRALPSIQTSSLLLACQLADNLQSTVRLLPWQLTRC